MKAAKIKQFLIFSLIAISVILFYGCKKQPKCGCGKDVIFELDDEQVRVQYNESTSIVIFNTPYTNPYASYYFCNPGEWVDSLANLNTQEYLLLSGKVYYECNYLMQSGNSYYQYPPVYQVEVTSVREDNYGK